jgi:hypothetical protein
MTRGPGLESRIGTGAAVNFGDSRVVFAITSLRRNGSVPIAEWYHSLSFAALVKCQAHGFLKQRARVPPAEIDRAIVRRGQFQANPARHSHEES